VVSAPKKELTKIVEEIFVKRRSRFASRAFAIWWKMLTTERAWTWQHVGLVKNPKSNHFHDVK
jgi:hypothetical protein